MKKRMNAVICVLLVLAMVCIPASYSALEAGQAGTRAMYDAEELSLIHI